MSILLVTYDVNNPGDKRKDLRGYIRSFEGVQLSESSYAIEVDVTPDEFISELLRVNVLDANDKCLVITLSRPFAGTGNESALSWLRSKLPAS
jgi:hypothetical protein